MSSDLFAIMDFEGHLRAINPAWSATLGYDEASLLARDATLQVHPDDQEALWAVVERLAPRGDDQEVRGPAEACRWFVAVDRMGSRA